MIRGALYHAFGLIAEGKIRKLLKDSHSPRDVQFDKLQQMVSANQESAFGRDHNFSSIRTISDFQSAVPIRDYDEIATYINRSVAGEKSVLTSDEPVMFATTSGTTGAQKFIPVTPGYMEEFRLASVVSGYHLLRNFPAISSGITLSVVSPAQEGITGGGTPYGAISGQLFQHEPFLIKKYISPIPYEVFLIKDYETRYYTLLRLALGLPLSLFYTLNPSTICLLCRRLKNYSAQLVNDVRAGTITPPGEMHEAARQAVSKLISPDKVRAAELQTLALNDDFVPHRIWPKLSLISCWTKAAASFYLADFPEYFGEVPVCDITYGASEGRGTVFMGPGKQMLALQSHFFEFVPEAEMGSASPTVLLADQLEVGQNYFILFTTSGGLYRYNINDVVQVTGFLNATPLLEFQYKGGNVSSFTGEKITEYQVTSAMTKVAQRVDLNVRFFTVIPQFRPEPHYEIWVEPAHELQSTDISGLSARLSTEYDLQLQIENSEYKVKRESHRLSPVDVRFIESGSYEGFRKHLVACGVADAQIKVSHLNPKEEVRNYFSNHLVGKSTIDPKVLSSS